MKYPKFTICVLISNVKTELNNNILHEASSIQHMCVGTVYMILDITIKRNVSTSVPI